MKPPSSLRVELPISIGPSIGPDPWNSVSFLDVVIVQPNVPAFGSRLPSVAIVRRLLDRNARQISRSLESCS